VFELLPVEKAGSLLYGPVLNISPSGHTIDITLALDKLAMPSTSAPCTGQ
jgi:hypothetical protein